jgi:hypothetical protein
METQTMKTDPNLVMILKTDSGYGGVTVAWASFGYWGPNQAMKSPSFNSSPHNPGHRYRHLQDFYVRAQRDPGTSRRFYAWKALYHQPYTVELDEATLMINNLRRVKRTLDTKEKADGRAQDLATYLIRVAQVFGCRTFVTYSPDLQPDGTHWRTGDHAFVQSWVHQFEHATAAA